MELSFDISCPGCNHTFKESASNMKPGNTCICPKCKKTIKFSGDDVSKAEKDINDSINDLKNTFKTFGK